jgi:hypothetical protein
LGFSQTVQPASDLFDAQPIDVGIRRGTAPIKNAEKRAADRAKRPSCRRSGLPDLSVVAPNDVSPIMPMLASVRAGRRGAVSGPLGRIQVES